MSKRGLTVMALAALVAALAGCVGIPESGSVQSGPLISDPDNPEVEFVPAGPQTDASQEDILAGFFQAVRSPQSGYEVARKFFTRAEAQRWKPDGSTQIRSGPPATLAGSGDDSLLYTFTSDAAVDDLGRYTEPPAAAQTLRFDFVKEGGQWRISQAPDGIVLSRTSFDLVFAERALYFFDPGYRYLVPDVRWFPKRTTIGSRTVEALLEGPTEWLRQAAVTGFPAATSVGDGSVEIESARAVVDLSPEALTATPVARDQMRQQLVATLGVPNVDITVRGAEVMIPDTPSADAIVPTVDSAPLIGTDSSFGFDAGSGVAGIDGLSDQVIAADATAASLSSDKTAVAFRSPAGVSIAMTTADEPVLLDSRSKLLRPAIDPSGFIWSARTSSAASLTAFRSDATAFPIQSAPPAENTVAAIAVSRDGTRLLMYMKSGVGSSLVVYGIIRQDNAPTKLGVPFVLPTPNGGPVDATWVDDRTVATVSSTGEITLLEIGGPSEVLGQLDRAVSIAGGSSGSLGLRVLNSGELWRPQGSGWVPTGIRASYLATKQ